MSRCTRPLSTAAAAVLFAMTGSGQRPPSPPNTFRDLPPDIFDNASVDVAKIAPNEYAIDLDKPSVRVLRARLRPQMRVPTHRHNPGLLVALTAVHLQFGRPDGSVFQIRLSPGQTRWVEGEIHSELNAAAAPCEFLFVETKGGGKADR
jgi:hypothetical protein